MKVLYLVATRRRKNRQHLTGRINGWKQILNILTVHYGERVTNRLWPNARHPHLHKR